MKVSATPGARCPKEGKPREYITEESETVPDSAYYLRLVADGSIIVIPEKSGIQEIKSKKPETTK